MCVCVCAALSLEDTPFLSEVQCAQQTKQQHQHQSWPTCYGHQQNKRSTHRYYAVIWFILIIMRCHMIPVDITEYEYVCVRVWGCIVYTLYSIDITAKQSRYTCTVLPAFPFYLLSRSILVGVGVAEEIDLAMRSTAQKNPLRAFTSLPFNFINTDSIYNYY